MTRTIYVTKKKINQFLTVCNISLLLMIGLQFIDYIKGAALKTLALATGMLILYATIAWYKQTPSGVRVVEENETT